MNRQKVKIGLLGLGTVGIGIVRLLDRNKEDLWLQTGVECEISSILVKNADKERHLFVPFEKITTDPYSILHDPEIDIIVEVIGGIQPAKTYIIEAIEQGKHVVTANKDLMALYGEEIFQKALENECDVFYEASVAGGVPIIKAMNDSFTSDRITKLFGIVNGTTNYILTRMSQDGATYDHVLREAQQLGYAEADPFSDVGGLDAARKMAILSTLGFHTTINLEEVEYKGIEGVTTEDIEYGEKLGYTMKLLGIAKKDDELIEVSVQPTMVRQDHPLASVHGVYNAVYVHGEAVGDTMFYGQGAGELPTATAVISDLVTVVKNMQLKVNGRGTVAPYIEKRMKQPEEIWSKYFLRFIVEDKSGVLAQITKVMADNKISLEQIIQHPFGSKGKAQLIIVTHVCSKKSLENMLEQLSATNVVNKIVSYYRVEGGD